MSCRPISPSAQRSDGLENLAGVTGAQVMVLAAAGENALNRIAIETAASYLAAFDPEPSERNGQPASRRGARDAAGRHRPRWRRISRSLEPTPKEFAQGKPARHAARGDSLPGPAAPRRRRSPRARPPTRLKLVTLGELGDPAAKLTARRRRRLRREGQADGAVHGAAGVSRDDAADVCRGRSARRLPDPPRGDRRVRSQRNRGLSR